MHYIIFSVNEDVTLKEYKDSENIRTRFDELTKNTDDLLEELHALKVENCFVENSKKHRVIATNSRFLFVLIPSLDREWF